MSELVKIIVFVPNTHTNIVRQAMGEAGAGVIGNYDNCTFSSKGVGRFKPLEGANPAIGQVGKLEEVEEERIEASCLKKKAKKVIEVIKKVHPYEEVVLDVYPLIDLKEL